MERLDLLPMAVLLMIGGKLPARGKTCSHFRAFIDTHQQPLTSEQILTMCQRAFGQGK
ncbi:MAG TPA: hypothetical protein VKR06_10080 [Ktedonosporobacter sp.]|nr:hypothetical protein [Ktedonosporobacter sp.]